MLGILPDRLHHRCEPGDRATSQVVAVREAAGKNDCAETVKIGFAVVDQPGGNPDVVLEGVQRVVIAITAGKGDDPNTPIGRACAHGRVSSTIVTAYVSITGLASRRSHIAATAASASRSFDAATLTRKKRPDRTPDTPSYPSDLSPPSTASPWGSLTPGFGSTITSAAQRRTSPVVGPPGCDPLTHSTTDSFLAKRSRRCRCARPHRLQAGDPAGSSGWLPAVNR